MGSESFVWLTKAKVDVAGGLLIAALVIPLVFLYRSGQKRAAENAALQEQTRQLANVRRENSRLRALQVNPAELARLRLDHAELRRLRREMEDLQREASAAGELRTNYSRLQAAVSNYQSVAEAAEARLFVRVTEAKDVGVNTPANLMQTWVWAMRTGDTNRIEQLWDWPREAPAAARRHFLQQVAQATKEGDYIPTDPEAMMGFRVLEQKPVSDTDIDLHVENYTNQGTTRQQTIRLRHEGDNWKVVIGKDGNLIESTSAPTQ